MKYVLASGSPRRKELLSLLGIEYSVCKAIGEEIPVGNSPAEIVENLSKQKAMEVAEKIIKESGHSLEDEIMVFGADTLVAKDGQVLGKPVDEKDAVRMLTYLQGTSHQVYTGVTIAIIADGEITSFTFSEKTEVEFYEVSEEEIDSYVQTKDPMDKAGAYAIQGIWGRHVKGLQGDYNNVVGLPVARIYQECKARGILF